MWQGNRLLIKQLRRIPVHSVNQPCQERPKAEKTEWSHNLHVSPATIHHTEAVFSIVRWIYGRRQDDPMDDFGCTYGYLGHISECHSSTAVHLGQDYEANLRYVKNNLWNSVGQLFRETGKLISEQKWNHGYKDYWFQRCHVDVDKLVVWKGLSDHQRQNLRILRLCALCRKNGRWYHCDLEEKN